MNEQQAAGRQGAVCVMSRGSGGGHLSQGCACELAGTNRGCTERLSWVGQENVNEVLGQSLDAC